MDITYRVLLPDDADLYRIIRLEALQANPEAYGSSYAEALKQSQLYFEEAILSASQSNWVMGIFDSDDLIGIFAYSDENCFSISKAGTLIQMYVKASHRGKGLGLELTTNILKEIFQTHAVDNVVLEVKVGNESAKAVYIKAGFKSIALQNTSALSEILIITRQQRSLIQN